MSLNDLYTLNGTPSNQKSNQLVEYLVELDINSQTLIAQLQCLRFKLNNISNRSDATDGTNSKTINGTFVDEWVCLEMKSNEVILSPPESQITNGFSAKAVLKKELFHTYNHPKETSYVFQVKMGMLLDCIFLCASSSKIAESMINMKYPGRENSLVVSSGKGGRNSVCSIRTKPVNNIIQDVEFGSSSISRFEIDAQVLREALKEILYWQQGVVIEIDPDRFILRTKTNDFTAVNVSIESRMKAFFQYKCHNDGMKDEYSWDHLFKCLQPLSSKLINKVQVTTNEKHMTRFRYFSNGEKNSIVEYVIHPINYGFDSISDDEMNGF